jgi:hypothetical protein
MGFEIVFPILAGVISLLFGGLLSHFKPVLKSYLQKKKFEQPDSKLFQNIAKTFEINLEDQPVSYQDRIMGALEALKKASVEMSKANAEVNEIMSEKQRTLGELEKKLLFLSAEENKLSTKIEALQNVPLEAVQHFEDILSRGEKRSAYRDYILFGTGVVVSVVVSIVLKVLDYA